MDNLKDYIFYTITGDLSPAYEGLVFGIKRTFSNEHQSYWGRFLDISDNIFSESDIRAADWGWSIEKIVEDGSIMFACLDPEKEVEVNSSYMLFLPSVPTSFQLTQLEAFLPQIETLDLCVGGSLEIVDQIQTLRKKGVEELSILKQYIEKHKDVVKINVYEKKVMN